MGEILYSLMWGCIVIAIFKGGGYLYWKWADRMKEESARRSGQKFLIKHNPDGSEKTLVQREQEYYEWVANSAKEAKRKIDREKGIYHDDDYYNDYYGL